ncbi:hypothetical protein MKW98_020190 [Papaver atlanticum]|uniref:Uncharacterized protein n=1 Tax=Papaver atlanticum TaxID=357466 RepID=A0AAD4XAK4_9MAGN|nr:hypothetical protein MKW98_020190 [Papaver atlanticum]
MLSLDASFSYFSDKNQASSPQSQRRKFTAIRLSFKRPHLMKEIKATDFYIMHLQEASLLEGTVRKIFAYGAQ